MCTNPLSEPTSVCSAGDSGVCGGSLSRWCHIEEPEQGKACQLLSLDQYIAFCGVRVRLFPGVTRVLVQVQRLPGCPSPSPSDSCVSWAAPATAEQQRCSRAACHILLWLSPLLRYVKLLTWTYGPWRREDFLMESGRGWLWVSFWKCSVPGQSSVPAGGAGSRHFPARDPLHFVESSRYSWFNEDAEVISLQGILSYILYLFSVLCFIFLSWG